MYVKKFIGVTVSEALALARRELGEEALLLATRSSADEGTRTGIEVTVAVERPRPREGPRPVLSRPASQPGAPRPGPEPAVDLRGSQPGASHVDSRLAIARSTATQHPGGRADAVRS